MGGEFVLVSAVAAGEGNEGRGRVEAGTYVCRPRGDGVQQMGLDRDSAGGRTMAAMVVRLMVSYVFLFFGHRPIAPTGSDRTE